MLPLSGWSYCKPITVQNAYVDEDLPYFTFMVFAVADTFLGAHALANGYDIRFTLADGVTLLNYERRMFSIAGGAATGVWAVLIPTVHTAGGDIIGIHYGKASAPDVSSGPDAYDANYKFVAPLDEAYGTAAGNYKDRKSGHDLTLTDADADSGQANGPINKAVDLNGDADYLNTATHADFDPGSKVTLEGWINFDVLPATNADLVSTKPGYVVWGLRIHTAYFRYLAYTPPGFPIIDEGTPATGIWYYMVFTYDRTLSSNRAKAFRQGAPVGQADGNDADIATANSGLWIGKCGSNFPDGKIAEVRYSKDIARSAAWIKFTYRNITEADHEQTWGAEESRIIYTLAGSINGISVIGGNAKMTARLAGVMQSTSTLGGNIKVIMCLDGAIDGTSHLTGTTKLIMRLTGDVAGTSHLSGGIKSIMRLAGSMASHSTLTGNLTELFQHLKAILFTAKSRERIFTVPDRKRIRTAPDRGRIVVVDERE